MGPSFLMRQEYLLYLCSSFNISTFYRFHLCDAPWSKNELLYFLIKRMLLVFANFLRNETDQDSEDWRLGELSEPWCVDTGKDCSLKYYKKLTTCISKNLDIPQFSLQKELSFLDMLKSFILYERQTKITDTSLISFFLLNSRPIQKMISLCILLTNVPVLGNNGTLP